MSEVNLINNLNYLIKAHGSLTVSELARLTKVPQPTLHHILNGTTKRPRRQALEALAKFFSISISQLTGSLPLFSSIPENVKNNLKISTVPIIDWDLLTEWPKPLEGSEVQEIILDRKVAKNSFALVMKDNSMEPIFPQHSILVFDSMKEPKDRDFIITILQDDETIIFNRLFIDNGIHLIKKNDVGDSVQLVKIATAKVLGTLIEVRMILS